MHTPGLAKIISLTSVPNGNVQKFGDQYQCQHGELECQGNTLELCTIAHYNTTKDNIPKWFDPLVCYESLGENMISRGEKCATAYGLDWSALQTCYNGPEGKALFAAAYQQTLPTNHKFTPWVVVNGEAQMNPGAFVEAVCKAYTGPQPAACANPPTSDDDDGLVATLA